MQILKQLNRFLVLLQEVIIGTSVLLMACLMIANVFCRFLLGFSLAFAAEVTQFCIIANCFVGMAYAANKARHIRMTAIYDQLPLSSQKALLIFIQLLSFALMSILTFYSVHYVYSVYQLGGIYPATRLPFFVIYSIVPIGFGLTAIEYLAAMIQNFSDNKIYLSSGVVQTESTKTKVTPSL